MSKTHDTNPSPVLGYKSILAAAVTTCPKEACATDGALIKPLCRRSIPEPSALTDDQEVEKREEDIQYNAKKCNGYRKKKAPEENKHENDEITLTFGSIRQ